MQVIPADSSAPTVRRSSTLGDGDYTYEVERAVTQHLEGGSPMRFQLDNLMMFMDDLAHAKDLPLNERATQLYRASYLAANPDADPATLRYLAGPVVIVIDYGPRIKGTASLHEIAATGRPN